MAGDQYKVLRDTLTSSSWWQDPVTRNLHLKDMGVDTGALPDRVPANTIAKLVVEQLMHQGNQALKKAFEYYLELMRAGPDSYPELRAFLRELPNNTLVVPKIEIDKHLFSFSTRTRTGIVITCGVLAVIVVIIGIFHAELGIGAKATPTATSGADWHSILAQTAPTCNDPPGVIWQRPGSVDITSLNCGANGLAMQQTSSTNYAEIDLLQVNGAPVDQSNLKIQTTVAFPNPSDSATFAAILIQTPQVADQYGGFSLVINGSGFWRVDQTINQDTIVNRASGQVVIDSQHVVLLLQVYNNILEANIDGSVVAKNITDTLDPNPGAIGLLVEHQHSPSSLVVYSDFKIQKFSLTTPSFSTSWPYREKPFILDTLTKDDGLWYVSIANNPNYSCTFINGKGYQAYGSKYVGIPCYLKEQQWTNVAFEADFTFVSGGPTRGAALSFDDDISGSFYVFAIEANGDYLLRLFHGTNIVKPDLVTGYENYDSNKTNTIGIVLKNHDIGLYLDGSLIKSVTDTSLSQGFVSVQSYGENGDAATVLFTNARIWNP